MFKSGKDYLGVSLSDDAFKIVRLKNTPTGSKVLDLTKRQIKELSEDELPQLIASSLAEMKVRRPKAILSVSSSIVTTKNIEIPSTDPEEIKSIIDLQSGRHTPYAREEILVGYITIGVFQRNYTKVLLVVVNREAINKQVSVFERGGIVVEQVLFAPEGVAHFYAQALNMGDDEEVPVGLIDVASNTTNFIIDYNKTVATCRSIPVGMNQLIKEFQPSTDKLISELIKSLEAYENEDVSKMPETYILTSDEPIVKEMQPFLQEKLKANVKVMPYLDFVQADQPIMVKLVSNYNDDSFLSEISIGIACNEGQIDLTPDEVKVQRALEDKGRQIAIMGVLVIVFMLLVTAVFYSKPYFREMHLKKVAEIYDEKRSEVKELQQTARNTQIIKDYLRSRKLGLDVLKELYALVPNQIYLENIFMDEYGKIKIQGVSETLATVYDFITSLKNSELFKDAEVKSTSDKKDRGKNVQAFDIEIMHINAEEVEEEKEEGEVEEEAEE